MNDLNKMRTGIIRELKNIRKFFDMMESGVKTKNPIKVSRAYTFLRILVHHMDNGDLTPTAIELFEALEESYEESKKGQESAPNL